MVFGRDQSGASKGGNDGSMSAGAFGKLPKLREFVRIRMTGELTKSFESWLEQAMGWAAGHRGEGWSDAYENGLPYAFVYRPPGNIATNDVLVGVIGPSNDAVGRKFPFVVFSPIDQRRLYADPHLVPLMLGDFLEAATDAMFGVTQLGAAPLVEGRVHHVRPPDTGALEGYTQDYNTWIQGTLLRTAWGAIYGDPSSPRPIQALHTIFEALAPFRGREKPNTPLSVRLPLGMGGAAATAFWIDVVRSIARWKATAPSVFWSSDGVSGAVLVQLGDVPTSSLAELWSPDPNSDHVCDLTTPSSVDQRRFLGRLPHVVAKQLERSDILVVDFLRTLREAA